MLLTPGRALVLVCVAWTALTLAISLSTPAWEANDEPDHVRNVETLVGGSWYRIQPGAGFEAHQAPLYYLAIAGYESLLGLDAKPPAPQLVAPEAGVAHGIFRHDVPSDGSDQRRVGLLRLPSVLFGLLTILLTAAAARRLSGDPWTPVVAAALVAGVPKFAFLSGVVNNDNLSNLLGAVATILVVAALGGRDVPPWSHPGRTAAALGAVAGALVITKLSAATVLPALLVTALLAAGDRRSAARGAAAFAAAFLAVAGWWLVQNQVRYGDPLAASATREHLRDLFPPLFVVDPPLEQAFVTLPQGVWRSFWYSSGWNQFYWSSWSLHLPLWLGLGAGIAGLVLPRNRALPAPPRTVVMLGVFALSAAATIWVLGLQTSQTQARVAFVGLPAVAVLFALGTERLRLPTLVRFALPTAGFLGACVALQRDVLGVYF